MEGIFVDANPLMRAYNERHSKHKRARELFREIIEKKKYGTPYITDYVFQEILNGFLIETKSNPRGTIAAIMRKEGKSEAEIERSCFETAQKIDDAVSKSAYLELEKLDEGAWTDAKEYIFKYRNIRLGFIDWTIIAYMKQKKLKYLWSDDKGFDGLKQIDEFKDITLIY